MQQVTFVLIFTALSFRLHSQNFGSAIIGLILASVARFRATGGDWTKVMVRAGVEGQVLDGINLKIYLAHIHDAIISGKQLVRQLILAPS